MLHCNMTPFGKISLARFNPERLLKPESLFVAGAGTELGETMLGQIAKGGFKGQIFTGSPEDLPAAIDLAIIACPPAQVAGVLAGLTGRVAGGAVVLCQAPDLREVALAAKLRVIGPHSFGIAAPGIGLNALRAHVVPVPGRVALIGQSPALARTILDWAEPNGIGFSHVIGIGGNADIGFARVLDYLSHDPGTGAVLLEIDRLRDPRLFLSAARAAARMRPIVALAPGARLRDASGTVLAGYAAALSRAGVLLVETINDFLAAAETLTRATVIHARPIRGETLAIISNSLSAGRLAADAALREHVVLATLSDETRQVIAMSMGCMPPACGPISLRDATPTKLADLAALVSGAPEVSGILVVHAPSGEADETTMAALIACADSIKMPLLVASMGEASGAANRHRLAAAGLAVFETPDMAVSGFSFLVQNQRNRAAARELPSSAVLSIAPDRQAVRQRIANARAADEEGLALGDSLALLAAYGIDIVPSRLVATADAAAQAAEEIGFPAVLKLARRRSDQDRPAGAIALDLPDAESVRAAMLVITARLRRRGDWPPAAEFLVQQQIGRSRELRIRVAEDPVLGPIIGFGPGGGDQSDVSALAVDLPPLNLTLARSLIARSSMAARLGAIRGFNAADFDEIAGCLVRVSQLIIDFPDIAAIDLDPIFADEHGIKVGGARIRLRPAGSERPSLVITPYPADMITTFTAKGRTFTLRPIRPEDAQAHGALFSRVSPEDIRYRFFSAMRQLSAEQTARMTQVDYMREMAIIAVDEQTGFTCGVARLVRGDTDGTEGEFAVLVDPGAKGLGLATTLMRALIAWGDRQGVSEIIGQILADNHPMIAFARSLGFAIRHPPGEDDIVEARLAL